MPTTEAGIDGGLWRDLYLVIGDPQDGGGWAMRSHARPGKRQLHSSQPFAVPSKVPSVAVPSSSWMVPTIWRMPSGPRSLKPLCKDVRASLTSVNTGQIATRPVMEAIRIRASRVGLGTTLRLGSNFTSAMGRTPLSRRGVATLPWNESGDERWGSDRGRANRTPASIICHTHKLGRFTSFI